MPLSRYITNFDMAWMWWMANAGMLVFNVLNATLIHATWRAFKREVAATRKQPPVDSQKRKSQ